MAISIFDLFKIGIGPSSSHTVGPMVAANSFLEGLDAQAGLGAVDSITVDLYGSLGATGKGHGSGKAVLLGLMGETPQKVDIEKSRTVIAEILENKTIDLAGTKTINFDYDEDITFHRKKSLPFHANGMMITACDASEDILYEKIYYSVGGGFVIDDSERDSAQSPIKQDDIELPFPFSTGNELLALCKAEKLSISELMMRNECAWRTEAEVKEKILELWDVMQECVTAGCKNTGILPGGLKVKRRAADLCHSLENELTHEQYQQGSMDWVNLYALAVNEESEETYALYKEETKRVISLKAVPLNPKLNATLLAWKGNNPCAGSISSVKIKCGVSSATVSISIPPSVEYIIMLRPLALFNKTDI